MKNPSKLINLSSQRTKTQQKQKSLYLPQLTQLRRLATSKNDKNNQNKVHKKYSDRNLINLYQRKSSKKLTDENYYCNIYYLKNAIKLSKKHANDQSILIKKIISPPQTIAHTDSTNLIKCEADQYQGMRSYNQDKVCMHSNIKIEGKIYSFFGIFDGHGSSSVSEYLRINLIKIFIRIVQQQVSSKYNISQILRKCFKQVQAKVNQLSKTNNFKGGSCASVLILCQNQYYVAHLGDSRILKIQIANQKQNPEIVQLTKDHNLQNQQQIRRIGQNKGRIYRQKHQQKQVMDKKPHRVYPGGLTVTRSIGDSIVKNNQNGNWLIAEPTVTSGDIQKQTLFVLVTDGALEKFSNQQIIQYFIKNKFTKEINLKKSIQTFLMNCIIKQTTDNVSVISVLASANL